MFMAWAGGQAILVPWMRVHDAASMRTFCAALQATSRPGIGCSTLIAQALIYVQSLFDTAFQGGRKIIDVSGDGEDSSKQVQFLRDTRDLLVSRGITGVVTR